MIIENTTVEMQTKLPYADYFKKEATRMMCEEIHTPVIMSIDISNFKYFNQMYGFDEGDKLIESCAHNFCHMNIDCILAYRIYVDHFILLIEAGNIDVESFKNKYEKLNQDFSRHINHEYPKARIRIYSGAYFVEDRMENLTSMIDKAQYARRSIKTNYLQCMAIYTEDMQIKTQTDSSVIPMFYSALENDRIKVYIQPKFSIDKQELIGGEALSRIMDENGNIIPPSIYIDILENTGLISRLDNYVIMKVIELQKKWYEQGCKITTISMNLSRVDFWELGFIRKIDSAIQKSGVPAKYFEFELTETIFCENLALVTKQMEFLRERGYTISMDDFGSGYNSLYMLGKIPIDVIKFDRGFVLNSLDKDAGRKIMKNLMNTFKDISFEVVCEGIENREEERIVQECGCNVVQGFLHDKPLPHEVFAEKYMNYGTERE